MPQRSVLCFARGLDPVISEELQSFPPEISSFCHFKRLRPSGEEFLRLNHKLIKEIVSCRKENKLLGHAAAHPAALERLTLGKESLTQGMFLENPTRIH